MNATESLKSFYKKMADILKSSLTSFPQSLNSLPLFNHHNEHIQYINRRRKTQWLVRPIIALLSVFFNKLQTIYDAIFEFCHKLPVTLCKVERYFCGEIYYCDL